MKLKLSLFTAFLIFCYLSCDADDHVQKPSISNVSIIDTLKNNDIKNYYTYFLRATATPEDKIKQTLTSLKYDIVLTKVEYSVIDPFGEIKTLSGLVCYPVLPKEEKKTQLTVISVQHGTLLSEAEAPSKSTLQTLNPIKNILTIVPAALSKGYIIVQPDYFGYGTDEKNMHYYMDTKSLATATRNLIENIPTLAAKQKLKINYDKLYLFGYSEGGTATISTLKSLSEKQSKFNSFITVAGSGGYDMTATADYIVQQTSGDSPTFSASYAWVVMSYNKIFHINRDLSSIFSSKVIQEINKYANNDLIMQTTTLPSAPTEVFDHIFTQNFLSRKDADFVNAFDQNNISDFNAKGSVTLVYGDKDTWVPPFNSTLLEDRLKKRGINVKTILFPGGTHATTFPVFAFNRFTSFTITNIIYIPNKIRLSKLDSLFVWYYLFGFFI